MLRSKPGVDRSLHFASGRDVVAPLQVNQRMRNCIPTLFGVAFLLTQNAYSADVYEFGYSKETNRTVVTVHKESGYNLASDSELSEESKEVEAVEEGDIDDFGNSDMADSDYPANDNDNDNVDCGSSSTVGGYRVTTKNNCSKSGEPLIRIGN